MKIRTGFISNSSTSSFILVGIEIDRKTKSEIDGLEDCLKNSYDLFEFDSGFGFIVMRLTEDTEEGKDYTKFNEKFNNKMLEAKKNIEKIIDEFKLDKNKYKVKVFAGPFQT